MLRSPLACNQWRQANSSSQQRERLPLPSPAAIKKELPFWGKKTSWEFCSHAISGAIFSGTSNKLGSVRDQKGAYLAEMLTSQIRCWKRTMVEKNGESPPLELWDHSRFLLTVEGNLLQENGEVVFEKPLCCCITTVIQ